MQINLSKEETRKIVNICLSKAGYADGVKAKVNIILDGSGSMYDLYADGTVQALVDRALAVGYTFDDDACIDVFDFAHGSSHRQLPQATQDDHGSYMQGKRMLGGGTEYAPVLRRMTDFYYGELVETKRTGGFFGLFGKKEEIRTAAEGRDGLEDQYPVFTMFISDGDSLEESSDRKVVGDLLKRHPDMFIQFIGIGNSSFSFLRELGNTYPNAGFVEVKNLSTMSDEDLMTGILNEKAKSVLQKSQGVDYER